MKLRRTFRRALRRRDARGLILLYHRVASVEFDPQHLCVDPGRFAEHLDVLGRLTAPVPLARIREAAASSGPPPVALTLDDGYDDSLLAAAPMLEANEVSATVFVVSGQVGANREFWWDELERLLLVQDNVPRSLELQVNGEVVRFDLDDGPIREPAGNVLGQSAPPARQDAYRALMEQLRPIDPPGRDAIIDDLRRWADVTAGPRPTHRVLDEDQLRQLDAHVFVEVGAHTVGHPSLAALTPVRQSQEIFGSKRRLEELLGRRVSEFSYPFGGPTHYSIETVRAVAEAEFELACTTSRGRVGPGTDRFLLPRLFVEDWDGDEFERQLRAWMVA